MSWSESESWSENEVREAYRQAVETLGPETPCPEPELFAGFLLDEATAGQRERLAEHLETCTRCAAFLQELRPLAGWSERAVPRSTLPRSGLPRFVLPVRGAFALAAALLLTIAAGWIWSHLDPLAPRGPSVARGAPGGVEPSAGARLETPPDRFDWPDVPGAAGYRLRLFDVSAEIIWESPMLDTSEVRLPGLVAADLEPGASYSWRVEVEGVQGSRLGPYWFSWTRADGDSSHDQQ